VEGYKRSGIGIAFYIFLCVVTLGLYGLFSYWWNILYLKLTHYRAEFENCDVVYIHPNSAEEGKTIAVIQEINLKDSKLRFFTYRKLNFIYKSEKKDFIKAELNVFKSFKDFRNEFISTPLTDDARSFRRVLYGENKIHIEVKNAIVLLFTEVLNPFYLFQLFSVTVWMMELYWIYSLSILITSSLAALLELYETRKNLMNLAEMAKIKPSFVKRSDGKMVSTEELIPGDVIEIPSYFQAPCDLCILSGTCIVNESMLTGESVPVLKAPLPDDQDDKYLIDEHKNFTLYAGTEVVLSKQKSTALAPWIKLRRIPSS
jgi:magnesium-transporting ATPase (P-type)